MRVCESEKTCLNLLAGFSAWLERILWERDIYIYIYLGRDKATKCCTCCSWPCSEADRDGDAMLILSCHGNCRSSMNLLGAMVAPMPRQQPVPTRKSSSTMRQGQTISVDSMMDTSGIGRDREKKHDFKIRENTQSYNLQKGLLQVAGLAKVPAIYFVHPVVQFTVTIYDLHARMRQNIRMHSTHTHIHIHTYTIISAYKIA